MFGLEEEGETRPEHHLPSNMSTSYIYSKQKPKPSLKSLCLIVFCPVFMKAISQ